MATVHTQCMNSNRKSLKCVKKKKENVNADANVVPKRSRRLNNISLSSNFICYICPAGQVVLDTPLPLKNQKSCRISSIKPIAVSVSERVQFVVKGCNLFRSSARYSLAFQCMLEYICSSPSHFSNFVSDLINTSLLLHRY